MTVKELIETLEKIEDKNLDVIAWDGEVRTYNTLTDAIETIEYYMNDHGTAEERKCVTIF